LPTYRKKLTCRVGWSFNFTICAYSLRQYANIEWNQSSPKPLHSEFILSLKFEGM
jgi:hypothetical protein